jgi:hypothetical protein
VHLIIKKYFNPLNAELNPICHLLALLEAHPILHVSRVRVKAQMFGEQQKKYDGGCRRLQMRLKE